MTQFFLVLNAAFVALVVSMVAQGMDMSKDEKIRVKHIKMSKMRGLADESHQKILVKTPGG